MEVIVEVMPATATRGESNAHDEGIELCCETFGDRARPALLLVMGLGMQMLGWDAAFCEQLAARGWFVVRFDNRDIGRSTWCDDEVVPNTLLLVAKAALGFTPKVAYTLQDMARDAIGLLDALHIERAHVVGASMGGMIAQLMAVSYPDRLLSLTSIMSTTGSPELPSAKPEATMLLMTKPAANLDDYIAFHERLMKTLRAGSFPEDEVQDAARARASWARGYHPAGMARQLAAIIASGDRTDALKTIRVPTLVIHGRPDPLVPVAGGMATAAAIPGARLVLLERMGHALPTALWPELIAAIDAHAKGATAPGTTGPGTTA